MRIPLRIKFKKLKVKVSAGLHSLHFYSASIASTAYRAFGVVYTVSGKIASTRIPPGYVAS